MGYRAVAMAALVVSVSPARGAKRWGFTVDG